MKTILQLAGPLLVTLLAGMTFIGSTLAQEVTIPDPGLNAAVREALQKPIGPLTQQDMLRLTNLQACCRNIGSVQGLEAARNLKFLDLNSNALTNFIPATALTNLETIDLFNNHLTDFVLPINLPKLTLLDLGFNSLARCALPDGLTNLDTLFLEGNQLTNFTLPSGLTTLTFLDLTANGLSSFGFHPDMTNLISVLIFANQLTNVTFPAKLQQLKNLDLDFNRFRSFTVPAGLSNLNRLTLLGNQLTNLTLLPGMTRLNFLDVGDNQLSDLNLPSGLSSLSYLRLSGNKLTSLTLPPGMTNLATAFLRSNLLTQLTLPYDLTHLVQIDLIGNKLTSLTLPPDMIGLITLGLEGNPLETVVLSEALAAGNLAGTVALLRNQAVAVFTYPLSVQLIRLRQPIGAFQFAIAGPPGAYTVLGSTNLAAWSEVGRVSNELGRIVFTDVQANLSPVKFYQAQQGGPFTNMVFISPNTFTMGSPIIELHRDPNEGPQTRVTLSRGFWIGQYEVTQAEYLSVMHTNPTFFPGDLSRPVSSVSWLDATNYCAKLTAQELAAGRIPPGSRYRLPTEAEWECAARAGTATRFSYGDDPDYASLTNHAWYFLNGALTVHPVGQKLPNPWGLYDMEGNVWEWCLDWLGALSGGAVTDPLGPLSNPLGVKVIRGGAYDFSETDCRSARRFFFGVHPALTDTDLGFRVVLATDPQ